MPGGPPVSHLRTLNSTTIFLRKPQTPSDSAHFWLSLGTSSISLRLELSTHLSLDQ